MKIFVGPRTPAKKNIAVIMIGLHLLLLAGCSHSLEITNLSKYNSTTATSCESHVSVGIIGKAQDYEDSRIVKSAGTELSKYGAEVLIPYSESSSKPVDIIATIGVTPRHEGSGWNFLINFPGFLIPPCQYK